MLFAIGMFIIFVLIILDRHYDVNQIRYPFLGTAESIGLAFVFLSLIVYGLNYML